MLASVVDVRSNKGEFRLRAVRPEHSESFAERHDTNVSMCLRSILGSERALTAPRLSPNCILFGWIRADFRSVVAHWSSWADCIHMIRQRHPSVAVILITGIHRGPAPCFAAVRTCQGTLEEAGLEIPSWRTLADTLSQREDGTEPAEPKVGWQHRATRCLEDQHLRVQLWPTLTDPVRVLMRSQCGPLASAALTALPTSPHDQTGSTTIPHVVVSTPP